MVSSVEQLRSLNLAQFIGIGTIQIYQNTISKVTPPRCRYTPSCSQYGIDALSEWGLIEGIKLTRQRIQKCHPPHGGSDPVPRKQIKQSSFLAANKITQQHLDNSNFETIKKRELTANFIDYDHHFRLILSYPKGREFISLEDFRAKIRELNQYVFEVPNYALLYRIANLEIGVIHDYYLLRFAGTVSSGYLENSVNEVIDYIIEQLAGFLLAARAKEFQPLYFQVDGQTYLEPKPGQKAVPATYQPQRDFWDYTSDTGIWDVYWGNFVFDMIEGVAEISGLVDDLFPSDIDLDSITTEDSNGGGCSAEGSETDAFGADGSDSDGCDSDGCDSGGCDSGGCDLGGCDLGGCDGCG
ncbi:Putative membrane protein insertion efficiency factor (modular protein) [Hyella patelloides LEGE 07179]|uniref:Putative membrane protein insertion efficiency factor n=1 Tax=Hyella patelloides LEGE 07179 TaxID=945734 RepID=A0A563VXV5_9CYAN|nr:membrane protein insertion efficiency factor YidD [Hyella patelloides]VEP16251.1 Putative membrane protein insertion efficiency factor (modular protein) [Hyella patelloides LEGE 07179]